MLGTPNKYMMPNKIHALKNKYSHITLFYLYFIFHKFPQNCPRLARFMNFY